MCGSAWVLPGYGKRPRPMTPWTPLETRKHDLDAVALSPCLTFGSVPINNHPLLFPPCVTHSVHVVHQMPAKLQTKRRHISFRNSFPSIFNLPGYSQVYWWWILIDHSINMPVLFYYTILEVRAWWQRRKQVVSAMHLGLCGCSQIDLKSCAFPKRIRIVRNDLSFCLNTVLQCCL